MYPIISCNYVCKYFSGVQALNNVKIELYPGEIHALVGENGAGKSTLIKILTGIHNLDSGTILYNGEKVEIDSIKTAKKLGIAVIHQELSIVKALNAVENIFLGKEIMKNGPFKTLDMKRMIAEAEEIFQVLEVEIPLTIKAGFLSVGQCQLIEIAKALKENAKILILDEPTTALTLEDTEALFKVLRRLKSQGVAILYVSHRMEEIYKLCDTITVFRDGQFISSMKKSELPQNKLISLMVGREITNMYPRKVRKHDIALLEVKDLGKKGVIKDISFTLNKGELLGIGGLMGAGRTELVRILAGIDTADHGEIILNGKRLNMKHPSEAIKEGIVLAPEDRKRSGLHVNLNVNDNITLPTISKFQKQMNINKKQEQKEVDNIVNKLSIKMAGTKQKVRSLSGGNQQKVAVGKWLLVENINVYIMDEPTRGVDVGAKFEIYSIMQDILDQGSAIIMVSSDLPELIGMSDRILVMREGSITGELQQSEATEEAVMHLATRGKKE